MRPRRLRLCSAVARRLLDDEYLARRAAALPNEPLGVGVHKPWPQRTPGVVLIVVLAAQYERCGRRWRLVLAERRRRRNAVLVAVGVLELSRRAGHVELVQQREQIAARERHLDPALAFEVHDVQP